MNLHQTLIAVTLLLASVASARQAVTPGAVVDVLQRIQGSWKTTCALNDDISRRHHLTITFTHIAVSRREYSDSECRVERQRLDSRYRFTLAEPIITKNGDRAYALNLSEDVGGESVSAVQPNLVRVQSGKLVLGNPEFSPVVKRPDSLDYRTVFTR